MSRHDDNAGPARPARYRQPDGEYVPPKAAPRRPGADDALALPLSTTRRKQNMPPKILEEHTMQERRDKLLALLRKGPKHRRDIAVELHIAKGRTLDNLLHDLKSKDQIQNDGAGTWSLVGMPDDEPPERAGHTDEPAGPDAPVTEPTGDREDDPSPAAEGAEDQHCYTCGTAHRSDEPCARPEVASDEMLENFHEGRRLSEAGAALMEAIAPPPAERIVLDPQRVGILSDGTLLLEDSDGTQVEISAATCRRAYALMDINIKWLGDLWDSHVEAQDK